MSDGSSFETLEDLRLAMTGPSIAEIDRQEKGRAMVPSENVAMIETNIMVSTATPHVEYCLEDGPGQGEWRPAVIVRVWGDITHDPPPACNLVVFVDGENDGYPRGQCVQWKTSRLYGEDDDALGHWRWPELLGEVINVSDERG